MLKYLPLFHALRLVVWAIAFFLGGAVLVMNLQVRRDLAEIRANVEALTTQRDEALAVAEVWRLLAVHTARKCGTQEQEM